MCRPECRWTEAAELRAARPRRPTNSGRWIRWPRTSRRCWRCKRTGAVTFDYGNNIRTVRSIAGAVEDAFEFPGFVPAYIRPLFCEGSGPFRWVALSGDPATSPRPTIWCWSCSRKTMRCALDRLAREQFTFRDCRRASAGWATASAPKWAAINDLVSAATRRRRSRSAAITSIRFGGVALSRNGRHEGRLRRGRRLAPAERVAQHGARRELGLVPSWRWRGHRLFASTRAGLRGGWHRRGGGGSSAC